MAWKEPLYQTVILELFSWVTVYIGIPANVVVLSYFVWKHNGNRTVLFLYRCLGIVDLALTSLMFAIEISKYNHNRPVLFENAVFCDAWSFTWNTMVRMSVFVTGLFTAIRTRTLLHPLTTKVNTRWVMFATISYALLVSAQSSLPFWYNKRAHFSSKFSCCVWQYMKILPINSIEIKVAITFAYLIQLLLPIFPITLCLIAQVYHIYKTRKVRISKIRQRALRTVVSITTLYVVINVPFATIIIANSVAVVSNFSINVLKGLSLDVVVFANKMTFIYSVMLNSMLNAVCIALVRRREIKGFLKNSMLSVKYLGVLIVRVSQVIFIQCFRGLIVIVRRRGHNTA